MRLVDRLGVMWHAPVAGLQVQYAKRNVLSVKDWTWAREGMVIEQEVVEQAARGQVQINRLKHYYLETYHYDMSVTPDVCEGSKLVVARCASTWELAYQFARGLFEVQYKGMSTKQRLAAMAARKNGYAPTRDAARRADLSRGGGGGAAGRRGGVRTRAAQRAGVCAAGWPERGAPEVWHG